jgi:MoaD family protein
MRVRVHFYSYCKDLTGCTETEEEVPARSTLGDLVVRLHQRYPKLVPMAKSILMAVGVDYQDSAYELKDGDEVSLFPPVQGG